MKRFGLFLTVLTLCIFTHAEDQTAPAKECCLVRDGYQGVCKVTPAENETCESILSYLNTPATVGKSYCGGSKLRGGWKLVDCEEESESDR